MSFNALIIFSVSCQNFDFVVFSLLVKKSVKNMAKLGWKRFTFSAEKTRVKNPPHAQYKYWFPTNENQPKQKYLLSCPANRADSGCQANKRTEQKDWETAYAIPQQCRRERKPVNDSLLSWRKQERKWLVLRPLDGSLPSSLSRGNLFKDEPLLLWLFSFVAVVLPRGTRALNRVNKIIWNIQVIYFKLGIDYL